jgi:hypothetical protein
MLQILPFLATLPAALFAGTALYINVAEHPSRIRGDISFALAQWAISYKRSAGRPGTVHFPALDSALARVCRLSTSGFQRTWSRPVYLLVRVPLQLFLIG